MLGHLEALHTNVVLAKASAQTLFGSMFSKACLWASSDASSICYLEHVLPSGSLICMTIGAQRGNVDMCWAECWQQHASLRGYARLKTQFCEGGWHITGSAGFWGIGADAPANVSTIVARPWPQTHMKYCKL